MPRDDLSGTEAALAEAKEWLRMHGDYNLQISVNYLYNTYNVTGLYLGSLVFMSHGMTLAKHINKVLEALKKDFNGKQ